MSEKYKVRDQERLYFITFAVEGWIDVFTRQQYKDIVIDSLRFCQKEKGLIIYGWCLMTNHIHLIVGRTVEHRIEEIVRDLKNLLLCRSVAPFESNMQESRRIWMLRLFKSAGLDSKKHINYKFWQNEYHPVELNTKEMMDQKLEYIHDNPVKEGIVERPEDYIYSSARDYTGRKGLLNIVLWIGPKISSTNDCTGTKFQFASSHFMSLLRITEVTSSPVWANKGRVIMQSMNKSIVCVFICFD
jgi:putative transposase